MHMPVHWLFLIEIWIQIRGFRYKIHSKVVLFSMPREVICGSKKNCFSLTANYIGKHSDFLYGGILKLMLGTFFHSFSLVHVLITEQKLGFDRHSYFPLFANSYTSQIMRKSNNEKI